MVRTQIQLTERQSRAIKERSAQHGVSAAEYIRQAVEMRLQQETTPEREELVRRALAAVGCGHSGVGDVSIRHDDYFVEAILQ